MVGLSRAGWLKRSLSAARPHFVWQSSVRVALCIGGPFFVGAVTGYLSEAMWMSFAAMFFAAGEKPAALFQTVIRKVIFVVPFSCAAFFTGYLSDLLGWAQFAFLALVAFIFGVLATWSPYLSAAAMQVLMITSITTGMTDRPYARYALFFLLGAIVYAVGVLIEGVARQKLTEPKKVEQAISVLADNCEARAQALTSGELSVRNGRVIPNQASDAAITRFADAFAAAAIPELMTPKYEAVLSALDLTEAEVWETPSPEALENVAAELRNLLAGSSPGAVSGESIPALKEVPALGDLALAYRAYIGTGERSSRVDLVPQAKAVAAGRGKRWTNFALTSGFRLCLCFSIGLLAGFLLPMDHVFWVATTVAMVMTPNMSAVVSRALQRCVGAVIGVIIATLLLWIDNSNYWLAFCITAAGFALPWIGSASAIYKQFFMIPIILLFGDIIIPGAHDPHFYGPERLLSTVAGGAIVYVFGYLLWPKMRAPEFQDGFRPLHSALVAYLRGGSQAQTGLAATDGLRLSVYKALSTFRQKLLVAAAEPPPTSTQAERWLPVALASGRMCDQTTGVLEEPKRDVHSINQLADVLASVPSEQAREVSAPPDLALLAAAIRHLNRRVELSEVRA